EWLREHPEVTARHPFRARPVGVDWSVEDLRLAVGAGDHQGGGSAAIEVDAVGGAEALQPQADILDRRPQAPFILPPVDDEQVEESPIGGDAGGGSPGARAS